MRTNYPEPTEVGETLDAPCPFFARGTSCYAPHKGFVCTRDKNHEGPHIAHSAPYHRCAVWNDEVKTEQAPAPPNDGGPAFPIPDIYHTPGVQIEYGVTGMTLRDYFAASYRVKRVGPDSVPFGYSVAPLCDMLGIKPPEPNNPKDYLRADLEVEAHIKYMAADAMIAARDKKEASEP